MRRVLPDLDVLQINLQPVVSRVQRTSDNHIHVAVTPKYGFNLTIIAPVEIVKQKIWGATPIRGDSKVCQNFTDARVGNAFRRNPLAWLRIFQKCLNYLAK
jgi:hypothetical protein